MYEGAVKKRDILLSHMQIGLFGIHFAISIRKLKTIYKSPRNSLLIC